MYCDKHKSWAHKFECPICLQFENARLREKLIESTALAIGWTHAHACSALDNGIDLRAMKVPSILEKGLKQLEVIDEVSQ
jgi:hypothetical protein